MIEGYPDGDVNHALHCQAACGPDTDAGRDDTLGQGAQRVPPRTRAVRFPRLLRVGDRAAARAPLRRRDMGRDALRPGRMMRRPGRWRPNVIPAPGHAARSEVRAWPIPAHSLFSAAFPLCGMVLPPSEEGTILEALFDDRRNQAPSGIGNSAAPRSAAITQPT